MESSYYLISCETKVGCTEYISLISVEIRKNGK
jgi:hypothetical protein